MIGAGRMPVAVAALATGIATLAPAAYGGSAAVCTTVPATEVGRILGAPVRRTVVRDGVCVFSFRARPDVAVARSSADAGTWYRDTARAAARWHPRAVLRLGDRAIRWETATGQSVLGKARSRAIAALRGDERLFVAAVSAAGGPPLPSWEALIRLAQRAFR